jgi:hypothetical protein
MQHEAHSCLVNMPLQLQVAAPEDEFQVQRKVMRELLKPCVRQVIESDHRA